MNKKYTFAVDDFSIDENQSSHFAILDMKIVSSGMNAHKLPITPEAVKESAKSLFGKPVLTHYIEENDSLGGHDPEEIPVGVFLNNNVDIQEGADGKTWLSAKAYIWKKYFSHIIDVFKKNDGRTNISMEIEVLDSQIESDGYEWIKSFSFLGVTAIGVAPAIYGSGATVLQFSELADKASQEFSIKYNSLDFKIPSGVRKNAEQGLELRKEHNRGGTSVALSMAKYLSKNQTTDSKRIRQIAKYFQKHSGDDIEDKTSDTWISFQLWGGDAGRKWSSSLLKRMNELDDKQTAHFDTEGVDNTPKEVEDEKDNMDKNKQEDEKVEMEKPEDVEMEAPAETETEEKPEVEVEVEVGKRDDEGAEDSKEETSMSLDAYADVPAMLAMLGAETSETQQMFAEISKTEEKDFSVIASGLYFMLKKFAEKCMALEEKNKSAEGDVFALKEFKANVEQKQFQAKVEETLNGIKKFTTIEELEEWRNKAKSFSMDNVSEWEKEVKASLFSKLTEKVEPEEESEDKIVKMSLPFNSTTADNKNKQLIW